MRSGRTVAACAVLASLTCGCIEVGPDFSSPETAVRDQWMEAADSRVKTRDVDQTWWTVFDDEALDRLIETAFRQNLSVISAASRVLQSRAQLGIAIGNFYPQTQQAFGSITYDRQSERAPFATPGPASSFEYWQNQIGAQVAWEIDIWGKFRRSIESADAAFLAAIASYDDVLVSLVADVANNYVQIRTLDARLKIAKDNVKVQREGLNIAEIRFKGGTTTDRDVQQARTVLASTEATIPQLETALRQTKNALSVLLGIPPSPLDGLLDPSKGIPVAPTDVAVGIPADLLRRRPDVRSAELQAAAQSAQIGVAKADLYPAFSLTGNFGFLASDWSNYNLSDIFLAKSRSFSFGPSFQWNILNYGRITNNVRVQDAAFQALLINYQNTVLTAQKEVEDGLIGFLNSQVRTYYLTLSAQAAQRSLDLAIIQYREGITDFTTVLLAEQNLLQQQDALAVSQGDIPSFLIRTYRALGGGWQISHGQEALPPEIREAMSKRTDWGGMLSPQAIERVSDRPPNRYFPAPSW